RVRPWRVGRLSGSAAQSGWCASHADSSEHRQALDSVEPGDLLALRARSAEVAHRYFVRANAAAQQFRSELRVETESRLGQAKLAELLEWDEFQARVDVGHARVEHDV